MLNPEAIEKIKVLADEVSQREGCVFYDLEFSGSMSNRTLRVFIDHIGDPVTVEQCANVSRGLSLLLDVQDLIPGGKYELEVSSPGLERVLRVPNHYKGAVGKEVKVITFESIPGLKGEVKSLTGVLTATTDDAATLKIATDNNQRDAEVQIPYSNIKKAQTVFDYMRPEKRP